MCAQATKPRREARFAVGSRNGHKSTIWKLWVQGDETYLCSRMFGSEMKVSFHSSGACQWSCTDQWVCRQGDRKNADRHIVRWEAGQPVDTKAELLFRVDIPLSEIRALPPPADKKKVFWVSNVPSGATVRFLIYLTPTYQCDPAQEANLPHRHLFSLQQRSGRWVVMLVDLVSLSESDLDAARHAVRAQLPVEISTQVSPDHRFSLFIENSEDAPRGLLELCPYTE